MTGTEQFIASVVHSLAWPAAVLGAVAVFRKEVAGMLSSPVRRFKAGPVEFEFERIISSVEATLGKEPVPTELPSDSVLSTMEDLRPVAEKAPTAAVLEAHSRLEHALWELTKNVTDQGLPGAVRLARLAREHGLITPEAENAIQGVTTLRNLAAHGRQSDLSVAGAIDYLALIDALLFTIRQPPGKE